MVVFMKVTRASTLCGCLINSERGLTKVVVKTGPYEGSGKSHTTTS